MSAPAAPFSLSLAAWDDLDEQGARRVVSEIEARVPRARFVGFEDHGRRVAVFDVGGVPMVLVPGGASRLGLDDDLVDGTATEAWSRSFRREGHAAQQILGGPDVGRAPPADLLVALREATTAPREVELAPFLLERTSERDVARAGGDGEDPHEGMARAVVAEGFRLPTSDEWEHASLAGRRTLFRWGNTWPVDTDVWSGGPFEGHRAPNALGLVYRTDPYHAEIVDDPWELRAGDGGSLVCGEAGPIAWITFASVFRYRLSATEDRDIWFEQAHVRRALSISPRPGEGEVRPFVPRSVFDDAGLAVQTLTELLDGEGDVARLPDLDALRASHAGEARVLVAIAHAHRKLGRLDAAEEVARAALALSPSVGPWTTLAGVLRARGDVDGALAAQDEAVALRPDDPALHQTAGDLLREANRFAEAALRYERALALDSRAGWSRVQRLRCLFHATGETAHAAAVVEIAAGPAKGVAWIAEIADEVSPGWRGAD